VLLPCLKLQEQHWQSALITRMERRSKVQGTVTRMTLMHLLEVLVQGRQGYVERSVHGYTVQWQSVLTSRHHSPARESGNAKELQSSKDHAELCLRGVQPSRVHFEHSALEPSSA
jgi:hypothetical protein